MRYGRVKLPITMDRRWEVWMTFPSLSQISFALTCTLDSYSWQTNCSNWSHPSCDRSRCYKDPKAACECMSASQALNILELHYFVLPANRPDRPGPA